MSFSNYPPSGNIRRFDESFPRFLAVLFTVNQAIAITLEISRGGNRCGALGGGLAASGFTATPKERRGSIRIRRRRWQECKQRKYTERVETADPFSRHIRCAFSIEQIESAVVASVPPRAFRPGISLRFPIPGKLPAVPFSLPWKFRPFTV